MRIDRTRTDSAKARTMSRRTARAAKSAAVFLALAFGPTGAEMQQPQAAR
jgi:hypothetical protein